MANDKKINNRLLLLCTLTTLQLSAQNVGIGTATPVALLHVANNSVLFTAPASLPVLPALPPVSGPGNRTFWYADKAAFRTGGAAGTQWNIDNIGNYSFASGFGNQASAISSFAMGNFSTASGEFSTAIGNSVFSKVKSGVAFGSYNDFTDNPNPSAESPTDRIFQIGNGTDFSDRRNALTILRNGNIGVGNLTPDVPLAFSNTTGSKISFFSSGVTAQYGIGIQGSLLQVYSDIDESDIAFGYGGSSSFTERMRIRGNGNVGIGTILPANKLSVEGSADFTQNIAVGKSVVNDSYGLPGTLRSIEIHNSGTATSSQATLLLTTASLNGGIGGLYFASPSVTTGGGVLSGISSVYETAGNASAPSTGLTFSTRGGAALTTRMVIAGNGNVGIGVAVPAFMLDVGARMRIRSTSGFTAGLWLNNDANTVSNAFIGMRSDTEVGFFGQTGTPSWRFYVNTSTGDAWMQGALTQNSDARLKKDIVPLANSLQTIQQLNGYTYHWKDNSNPDEQIGLLAQELQKVYPQLVKENDKGILSVNYSGMVPVLLEAIKEQQRQLEELKKENKEILTLLNSLKKI